MAETRLFFWLFCLLPLSSSVFSDVVGHDVNVTAGDNVTLPCHLDPPFDVTDLMVEWTRDGVTVHVYRYKAEKPTDQDKHFRGRTFMFPDELVKGNISLRLTNTCKNDSGLYICHVPKLQHQVKEGNVSLIVRGDKKTPDDDEQTGDQTGVTVGSIMGVFISIIAVSAGTAFCCIKRRRREENNQDNNQQGGQQNPEEQIPMNPPAPSP